MFTLFSRSTARPAPARRRSRKLEAKNTLAVEDLDKRRMLTSWSVAYPPLPFGSMPTTSSAYSIPSSWSMPTYSTYGSQSSAFTSPLRNTYGQGSNFFQPFTTTFSPNYSTSDFFNTSSFFSPRSTTFGSSSFSTPVTFSNYGSGSSSSYVNSLGSLQSSVNELQRLNSQLVAMGGTPVSIPSSVTSVLNGNFGGGSSWGSPTQKGYSQADIAAMTSGGSRIVLKSPGYSVDNRVTDRGDRMMKTATENLFGKGGIVDSVTRTANVINRVYQPVARVVQPVSNVAARFGGSFISTPARRR